jgi:hypothetical protein
MFNDVSVNTLQVFAWPGEDIFVLVQEFYKLFLFFRVKVSPNCDRSVGVGG